MLNYFQNNPLELIGIVKSDNKGDMCIRNRMYEQLLRDMQLADHRHKRSQRQDVENGSLGDRSSPQEQLMQARKNLQIIERRKAEYVLGVDIPLQLIKEEQQLREDIGDLESKLGGI